MNKAIAHLGYAAMTTAMVAMTLGSCATKKTQQEKDNNLMEITKGNDMDDTYLIFGDAERSAIESTNDFALNLFRTQAGMDSKVVSPVSVAYLMALLANGANGSTQTEIMKALSMNGMSLTTLNETYNAIIKTASRHDSQTKVNIANCVTVNKNVTLKDNYTNAMQTIYNANVESMDFASPKALAKINKWCSKQTDGMIPKIVDQLDPNATAVLMNAVYFNGTWADKFEKADTKTENFRGYTRDIKKVPMMHQERKFSYSDNKDFAAVTLPYGNGIYSMTIILPAEGKSTTDIMKSLNAKTLEKTRHEMTECVVDLKLPRFSTTTETQLNKPIASLGATSMFESGKADFSNMTDASMFVSTMLQKAKIEVNEEGTKAAAVTAAIMTMSMLQPEEPRHVTFHANRPFIYLITELNSNAIFFIGQYTGAE